MHSVNYKGRKIEFTLKRKNVKNINLRVKRNLEVYVSANNQVPIDYIKEFVYSKGDWIERHLNHYKSLEKSSQGEREYIDGEVFSYLGKEYELKIFKSLEQEIKYFEGFIHLYVDNLDDKSKKEKLINNWYREKSEIIFKESLEKMHELMRVYRIDFPELKIRKMKSRWGTCYYRNNKVIINRMLIKAPKDCIDYVILHELIHFKYHKHDKNFYGAMDILMPDWRDRKKILDKVVVGEL